MATPITQKAATKYGSAPANQEVTVDAAGKNAAKFERMSPLKQTDLGPAFKPTQAQTNAANKKAAATPLKQSTVPDPIVTTNMGQNEAGEQREVTETTNYSQGDATIIAGAGGTPNLDKLNEGKIDLGPDFVPTQAQTDRANKEKADAIAADAALNVDTVVPGAIEAKVTKVVKDPTEERDTYNPLEVRQANRARNVADRGVRKAQRQFDKGKISQESLDAAKSQASSTYAQQNKGKNRANSDTYTANKKGNPNSTTYDLSGDEIKKAPPETTAPADPKTQTAKEFRVQKKTERKEARYDARQEKRKERIQKRHDKKTAPDTPDTPVEMRSTSPTKMWGAAKSGKTPFKMGGYMSKNK